MRPLAPTAPAALLLLVCALVLGGCALPGRGDSPFDPEVREALEEAQARRQTRLRADDAGPPPPRTAPEWLAEGDVQRDAGRPAQALWRYLRAHEADPDDPRPMLRIASLHLTREPARAEAIFRELAAAPGSPGIAYLGLGLARLAQGDFEAADEALARAAAAAPELAATARAHGVVLDHLGRPKEAQASYWRALDRHPDDPLTLNNLGVSYLATHEPGRAAEVLQRAAELAPRDRAVQNNLGLALVALGRDREALAAFRRAGGEQAARNNFATALLANGRVAEAVAEYERALLASGDARLTVLRNLRDARRLLRAEAEAAPHAAPGERPGEGAPSAAAPADAQSPEGVPSSPAPEASPPEVPPGTTTS